MDQRDDWHLTELLNNPTGRGDPFAAAVRATRMPMVITDPGRQDNPIVFVNESFQQLTGYGRDEIIGRNCRFLQGPDTDQLEVARIRRAIEDGNPIDVDLLNYRKDGSTFWNALFLSPVRDDAGIVRFFFASQLDVTERVETQSEIARQKTLVDREVRRRTAELEAALEAKTILLHEVDHRVKNNLNMIGSLLRLQARGITDPAVADKLNSMLERVEALATVHRRLYQGEDISRFDASAFLSSLATDVIGTAGRKDDIVVKRDLQPLFIASAQASAIGLVLNEILTNAVKHAFANSRKGELTIRSSVEGAVGRIEVCDDGPGIDLSNTSRTSLGMTLMTRMARQARVNVAFEPRSPGTNVVLTFPIEISQ